MEEEEGGELEVVDYYVDDDECEEKHKWSSKMMEAGKKLIMAGVLIASVPVVLPPLLAVSALGFAMSVPFGVVFASYTASHKLMTKLLPLPVPSNYQEEYYSNEDEEEEEDEMKMLSTDEDKNEIEMRIELVDDEDPLVADDVQIVIDRERKLEEEERESMKQMVEESADDGESSSASSENENIIHVNDDQELDGTQKKMLEETKQGPILMNDDDDVKQGNHDTPAAADGDQVKMAADDESLELKEEKHSSGLNGGLHEMQGGGDEEENMIWKKIDAIRVIVGFKAPRRSSYLEEVKALYLFTGIEPPQTSSAATSSELDAKLSFLMSVIGLK